MRERKPKEMLREPWVAAAGLSVGWTHPTYGPMHQATPRAEATSFEATPGVPSPAPAADSRKILDEIGMGAETDSLIASGAVLDNMDLFSRDVPA